jgi:hypothetical protein
MPKQRVFQFTNYVPPFLKILLKLLILVISSSKKLDTIDNYSIMFLSIDIVDHRLSVYIRRGVGDSSLLGLFTGSTSLFIGKEI